MSDTNDDVLASVDRFFTRAITEYGTTPKAADWPDPRQQRIRFAELAKLFPPEGSFTLLDYGCGYGALLDFLLDTSTACTYFGYDVSGSMIDAARKTHPGLDDHFFTELPAGKTYDYVVESGIFNLKLENATDPWDEMVHRTIAEFDRLSHRGFAFNMLSANREEHRKLPHLYYGDPLHFFDLCFRNYAPNVALAHDYGLWDFTILVRKQLP